MRKTILRDIFQFRRMANESLFAYDDYTVRCAIITFVKWGYSGF